MNKEQLLERKRHVLLQADGQSRALSAIINPENISDDGKFIYIGGYYSDMVTGWYPIDMILKDIVGIVREFPTAAEEEKVNSVEVSNSSSLFKRFCAKIKSMRRKNGNCN